MVVKDKRKKYTVPVQDIAVGAVFEDAGNLLFMKIDLDGSCYPPNLDYDTTDAAIDLEDFEVCFFNITTEVYPIHNAELILS